MYTLIDLLIELIVKLKWFNNIMKNRCSVKLEWDWLD